MSSFAICHQLCKSTFSSKTICNHHNFFFRPRLVCRSYSSSSGLDSAPHTNPVALPCSGPCSRAGGRQTLSHESYFKSLCWTSSQAPTRLSSMYIRKRMRSPQARLLVSCFRRLGLDLPLKPAGRESFCDSPGKPPRAEAQRAACVAARPVREPRRPAPGGAPHRDAAARCCAEAELA